MKVDSSNKNYRINTHIQQKILEITAKRNKIIATIKKEKVDTGHLYEIRNRIITLELQAVKISITLAKLILISLVLLDNNNLKELKTSKRKHVSFEAKPSSMNVDEIYETDEDELAKETEWILKKKPY